MGPAALFLLASFAAAGPQNVATVVSDVGPVKLAIGATAMNDRFAETIVIKGLTSGKIEFDVELKDGRRTKVTSYINVGASLLRLQISTMLRKRNESVKLMLTSGTNKKIRKPKVVVNAGNAQALHKKAKRKAFLKERETLVLRPPALDGERCKPDLAIPAKDLRTVWAGASRRGYDQSLFRVHCVTTSQVGELIERSASDANRVRIASFAFPYVADPEEYNALNLYFEDAKSIHALQKAMDKKVKRRFPKEAERVWFDLMMKADLKRGDVPRCKGTVEQIPSSILTRKLSTSSVSKRMKGIIDAVKGKCISISELSRGTTFMKEGNPKATQRELMTFYKGIWKSISDPEDFVIVAIKHLNEKNKLKFARTYGIRLRLLY